jgi:ABC-type phosphate/phosphonate transport system substrate-binding protein
MPDLTASLPMYNLPEMAAANAAFWQALSAEMADEGIEDLPHTLAFARPPVPDEIGTTTLFSQTCGYPLQTIYRGQYQLLGVPTYDADGCGEATHCAFILVREDSPFQKPDDLRGTVFALNSRHSNSGMNLPRLLFARLAERRPFFGKVVETGGHNASIERVAAGVADCASIDCLTYAFLRDHRPAFVAGLRVLAATPSSPAIPFVTAAATKPQQVAALRQALFRLAADPGRRPVLRALRIRTITPIDPGAYQVLLDYERQAAELGYPELA